MAGPLGRQTVGRLRHRVQIQAPTDTPNDFREAVQTWATEATTWARVEGFKGDEKMQSGRVQADVTHTVVMRLRTDVTAKKRLVWVSPAGTLTLNVVAVWPQTGEANWIEVWCRREG